MNITDQQVAKRMPCHGPNTAVMRLEDFALRVLLAVTCERRVRNKNLHILSVD
jgi:hypothetical protein